MKVDNLEADMKNITPSNPDAFKMFENAAKAFEAIGKTWGSRNGSANTPSVGADAVKQAKGGTLLLAIDMKPIVLAKAENWRKWRVTAEDYLEVMKSGMKRF